MKVTSPCKLLSAPAIWKFRIMVFGDHEECKIYWDRGRPVAKSNEIANRFITYHLFLLLYISYLESPKRFSQCLVLAPAHDQPEETQTFGLICPRQSLQENKLQPFRLIRTLRECCEPRYIQRTNHVSAVNHALAQ